MKHHQGNSTEGCVEVISAIGTIGTADDETGNGATNEAAAKAAKKANAKRFVLVSASKDRLQMVLLQHATDVMHESTQRQSFSYSFPCDCEILV